jgi:hypothetical protein
MPPVFAPADATKTEHRGRLDRICFSDPSQPFVILTLNDGSTMMGPANADDIVKGVVYRFLGRWELSQDKGYRFKFSTYIIQSAQSRAGVVKYLGDICETITNRIAGRLFDKYGSEAISRLRDDPVSVAVDLGIAPDICSEASAALQKDKRFGEVKVQLFTIFDRKGFPGRLITECIDKWGEKAPEIIRENPFELLPLSGAGFRRCDRLWGDFGIPKDSLVRGTHCAMHLLLSDSGGNTWVNAVALADRLREIAPGCDPVATFKAAIEQRQIAKRRDDKGELWLAAFSRSAAEPPTARRSGPPTASPSPPRTATDSRPNTKSSDSRGRPSSRSASSSADPARARVTARRSLSAS